MAQINNIKSKIQLKEELLTQRESSLDHKLNQIYQKEEELKKNQDEYNIKKTLLDQREIEISQKEKKVEEMLEYLENQQNPNLFNKMMNFGLNHVLPAKKKLKYGIEIPYVGMGTSRIQNVEEAIYNSIKNGIRLIDTAVKYGNEEQVGKGIKKALDEGICKREDLFIIGKIWLEEKEHPEEAIRGTLNRLQLDYLDLYLDHWPSGNNYADPSNIQQQVSIYEFWPKMEALVDKGLTKSIGLSNYNVQSMLNLLSFCRIKPVANEVEYHPYYYQENLKNFCDKENIAIIAYYPLARGNGARQYIKNHNGEMDSFKEECVEKLVKKYNKSPGQIIINWEVSQGIVSIPGTSRIERMAENLGALDFKMTDEDIKSLECFGKRMKFCGCRRFFGMNIMA